MLPALELKIWFAILDPFFEFVKNTAPCFYGSYASHRGNDANSINYWNWQGFDFPMIHRFTGKIDTLKVGPPLTNSSRVR